MAPRCPHLPGRPASMQPRVLDVGSGEARHGLGREEEVQTHGLGAVGVASGDGAVGGEANPAVPPCRRGGQGRAEGGHKITRLTVKLRTWFMEHSGKVNVCETTAPPLCYRLIQTIAVRIPATHLDGEFLLQSATIPPPRA